MVIQNKLKCLAIAITLFVLLVHIAEIVYVAIDPAYDLIKLNEVTRYAALIVIMILLFPLFDMIWLFILLKQEYLAVCSFHTRTTIGISTIFIALRYLACSILIVLSRYTNDYCNIKGLDLCTYLES